MQTSQEIELLKQQIKDNIISWYPQEDNMQYIIIRDFCKEDINKLSEAASKLQENGKILILMDNNLSIKSLSIDKINKKTLYTKREIEEVLDKYGLVYRKFYYPLQDCEKTNVIFTDKHLPDEETISRNITFYEENDIEIKKENEIFRNIINQDPNLFKIFANSFFIECSKNEFKDNEIEFVSFSNMRKEGYRIKTIIKGDKVYKKPINEKAENHIKNIEKNIDILNQCNINTLDSYSDSTIISIYQKNETTLDKIIIEKIQSGKLNEVKEIINKLYMELREKLIIVDERENVFDKYGIEYQKESIENLTFVKYGFWDMIFQNIFYIDNEYFFYDQEWLEENLPIEFIIYRTMIYTPQLGRKLDLEKTLKEFKINDENIKLFQQLDNKLQEKTRSTTSWKIHVQDNSLNRILNDLKQKNEQKDGKIYQLENDKEKITEECRKILNEKDARIRLLEENMEQTIELLHQAERTVEQIKSSISWKITEPLRKLRRIQKEKKK